jgi:hypothetical protein
MLQKGDRAAAVHELDLLTRGKVHSLAVVAQ